MGDGDAAEDDAAPANHAAGQQDADMKLQGDCHEDGSTGGGTAAVTLSVRRKNDTFYDDYLHRGEVEYAGSGLQTRTPLADMSYYEYGMYVKVVVGDPWALKSMQYALD